MNKFIKKFGEAVGDCLYTRPQTALSLLNAAYAVSGLQVKVLPDKRLLPHQKYAAIVNNHTIREPLINPDNSAVVNIFVPCETLQIMGISPQFLEGLAGFLNGAGSERAFIDYAENFGIPQTYCSYHKTLLGAALSGVVPKPRFIVNTTLACDANTSTFRLLADFWQAPHFTIDVPGEYSAETIAYVAAQLREMVSFIEDIMGKKLDGEKLKASMQRENRALKMYRAYLQELSGKYLPNDLSSEMYKFSFTHILLGTNEAQQYFQLLLKDVQNAAFSNGQTRILWVHTLPFWQDSIKNVFNFSNKYQLLCSDLNFDSLVEMDENRPYESMANRLLLNTMCGSVKNRAEKVLEMARLLRANGIIYFCHWGCKQTLGGAFLTKDLLEGEGIPVLLLDGDGCDRDNVNDGQMYTRLQAFLEILEAAG